jgi:DNA-binding NarL/FixJ family response regulator
MKDNGIIRIAIAETSVIIRSGMASALRRLPDVRIQPIEVPNADALQSCLRTQEIDILVVNPSFGDFFDVARFRGQLAGRKLQVVALVSTYVDTSLLNKYDASFFIFDNLSTLSEKIARLLHETSQTNNANKGRCGEGDDENQEMLSQREKEIVVCVVKGMTNKDIAQKLFLSIHTVISHRRNISKKLQIHSVSGLTIYAIVNKLIELSEVKDL